MQTFSGSAGQPGFAESVSRTLLEFQRYGWGPGDLEAWITALSENQRRSDALARKMSDLAQLWRTYNELLARGGWNDHPAWEAAAAEAVRGWGALDGCRLWVDGFSSFTALELELLAALL